MATVNSIVHLIAATLLVGFVAFWAFGDERARPPSLWLPWISLAVLIVTGVLMLPRWHVTWSEIASGQFFTTRFGAVLGVKSAGVVAMLAGFIFLTPGRSLWWRLQLLAGLGIVFLSIFLVR